MLSHPDLVHELLVKRHKSLNRPETIRNAFHDTFPENLFMSNGAYWQNQRKLMTPAFHSQRIKAYADTMVDYTLAEMGNWQTNHEIDIDASMVDITVKVIIKTMFGIDFDENAAEMTRLLTEMLEIGAIRAKRGFRIPAWLPIDENRTMQSHGAVFTQNMMQVINDWRKHGEDRGDLLSMLMLSRYDDGSPMTDDQIISELVTVFVAGHDTTAHTLAYAWYAMAENPDVETNLHEEIARVLQGRRATLEDLRNLTEKIVKEALRRHPVSNATSRQAIEDIELGGHHIEKGAIFTASPWILHFDERWWDDPHAFKPERWTVEKESTMPKYSYIPFGGGPRICIGNQFAMMEAKLVLATIAQHHRFALKPDFKLEVASRFTISPIDGIPMTVHQR